MTAIMIAFLINIHILCVFSEDDDQSYSFNKMSPILNFYEDYDIDRSLKKCPVS